MKKLSIIIPVYNAENHISKCLKSCIDQELSICEFEIIVINDGSTDNSLQIIKQITREYNNITVIDKLNEGVSSARNLGLNMAQGKYVGFVDADDYIHPKMYQLLLRNIQNSNSDLAYCGFIQFKENINQTNRFYPLQLTGNGSEIINELVTKRKSLPIWTCIIENQVIKGNNIRFEKKCKYGEDQEFMFMILCHCKYISFENEYLYYYRRNENNAVAQKKLAQFDYPIAMVRVKNYLIKNKISKSTAKHFDQVQIPWSINYVINNIVDSQITVKQIIECINVNHLNVYIKSNSKSLISSGIWNLNPYLYMYFYKTVKYLRLSLISARNICVKTN